MRKLSFYHHLYLVQPARKLGFKAFYETESASIKFQSDNAGMFRLFGRPSLGLRIMDYLEILEKGYALFVLQFLGEDFRI